MHKSLLPLIGMSAAVSLLVGCGGVSELTKERVARSETAVQSATQTIGNAETGAVELQRAKENLVKAQAALKAEKEKEAERYAQVAQLSAELAVAKSQSGAARKAADEVLASVETLRREAARP
jgi:methylthioribose-1-phosphate isomerase